MSRLGVEPRYFTFLFRESNCPAVERAALSALGEDFTSVSESLRLQIFIHLLKSAAFL